MFGPAQGKGRGGEGANGGVRTKVLSIKSGKLRRRRAGRIDALGHITLFFGKRCITVVSLRRGRASISLATAAWENWSNMSSYSPT